MAIRTFRTRVDTAALWASNNPTAALGEILVESDTQKFKFGNGSSAYNSLSYPASIGGSLVNSQSAAYTLVLGDAGSTIYHPSADTTARIWTIPANASVAFPIGTVVTFDNDVGAGILTIAITSDVMVLVGTAGSTGSRALAAGGRAVAQKVTATRWRISGGAELT